MNELPLVSICVITYNSAEFIIDTLESAKNQTYQNIELIVSDDCSTDSTVRVCQDWIERNKECFANCKIVTTPKNTGVSANCNRVVSSSNGKWIKLIAGDDYMYSNCIEDNIKYVSDNFDAKIVFSNYDILNAISGNQITHKTLHCLQDFFFAQDAIGQCEVLLSRNYLPAVSQFISSDLLKQYPFNELYKYMEDIPMWIKLTYNGNRIYFLDKTTVVYRRHESLVNTTNHFFSPRFRETATQFFWNERMQLMKSFGMNDVYVNYRRGMFCDDLAESLFQNKATKLNCCIYRVIHYFIFRYVHFDI